MICLLTACVTQGATYYLDSVEGLDGNAGTSAETAWQTWTKVEGSSSGGDTIYVLSPDATTYEVNWPADRIYMADQVYQYGITWTFDTDYRIGQYCQWDFWVYAPAGLTIETIDPASETLSDVTMYSGKTYEVTGDRTVNGSAINPVAASHGYDSRAASYNAGLNVALGVDAESPLVIEVGGAEPAIKSLVSSISLATGSIESNYSPHLSYAAVLTVVDTVPDPKSFRPAFCGVEKWDFDTDDIHWEYLGELTIIDWVPAIATMENYMRRPWIMHGPHINGSAIHPSGNMLHYYGRDFARRAHWSMLLCNMDYTVEQKTTLLYRVLQYGIDVSGMMRWPGAAEILKGNGGFTNGRKGPSVFAARILGSADIAALHAKSGDYLNDGAYGPANPPPDYIHFGNEDDQVFYVAQIDVTYTNGGSWNPDSRDDEKIPYSADDIGLPEWGIREAWEPWKSNNWLGTQYRNVSGCTMPCAALSALIIGAKTIWNNDAYFDYCDRYMGLMNDPPAGFGYLAYGTNGIDLQEDEAFTFDTWNAYRADYGDVWTGEEEEPPPPTKRYFIGGQTP
jgi:hypothetical protein